MKRTNDNSYLIVIDGMDRTGKDTLIDWVKKKNPNDFIVYKQETCEEANIDYRNVKAFEKYLINAMQKTYEDIAKLHKENPNKYIITSRLWISDSVYSTMFGRKHIVENIFRDNFEDLFNGNVINIILLWEDFETFTNRMKKIDDNYSLNEYSMTEFLKVKELFRDFGGMNNAQFIRINDETTPSDVYDKFKYILSSIF